LSDQRNLILAVVLSALVLFGWGFVAERFFPTANEPSTQVVDGKQVAVPKPAEDPTADAPAALRDRATVLRTTPRVPIATPSLRGSVNLTGARIDDLVLTRHTQDMRVNSPPVRLLSPGGAPVPISRSSAGPARASPCPARRRNGRRWATGSRPAGRCGCNGTMARASSSRSISASTRATCSPPARA
jgi:YidC/Oxa1 family membrane protein insertase